jgi:hypothetical protein
MELSIDLDVLPTPLLVEASSFGAVFFREWD